MPVLIFNKGLYVSLRVDFFGRSGSSFPSGAGDWNNHLILNGITFFWGSVIKGGHQKCFKPADVSGQLQSGQAEIMQL
jgi:hypothetical protein